MGKKTKTNQAAELSQSDSSKLLAVRRIKFRAWDSINKQMMEHDLISVLLKNVNNNPSRGKRQFYYLQFTGLYDCNGKEIYEGDIVLAIDSNVIGYIDFHGGEFCRTDGSCHWHLRNSKHLQQMPADFCMDAFEFVTSWQQEPFDTIILDPPYNLRKAREKYSGQFIGSFTKIKDEIPRILKPGGLVITLGYDSVGMSRKRGFQKIAICLICHLGDHNDTIAVVEKYIQQPLFEFSRAV